MKMDVQNYNIYNGFTFRETGLKKRIVCIPFSQISALIITPKSDNKEIVERLQVFLIGDEHSLDIHDENDIERFYNEYWRYKENVSFGNVCE